LYIAAAGPMELPSSFATSITSMQSASTMIRLHPTEVAWDKPFLITVRNISNIRQGRIATVCIVDYSTGCTRTLVDIKSSMSSEGDFLVALEKKNSFPSEIRLLIS
jgi:hypothetical protein